jgi:hypothetical protein
MKSYLALFLLFWIAACQPAPTVTIQPTNRYIRVGYLPALGSWIDKITHCAGQVSGITVGTFETTAYDPVDNQAQLEIFLQFSQNLPESGQVFLIGQDEIVLIVNTANPVDHLSIEAWSSILIGDHSNWSQIDTLITDLPLDIWLYPSENIVSKMLFAELTSVRPNTITANMAPDPKSMLEIVAGEAGAIGPIPSSWLETQQKPQTVKALGLTQDGTEVPIAVLDVLAVTEQDSDEDIQSLLICIQGLSE